MTKVEFPENISSEGGRGVTVLPEIFFDRKSPQISYESHIFTVCVKRGNIFRLFHKNTLRLNFFLLLILNLRESGFHLNFDRSLYDIIDVMQVYFVDYLHKSSLILVTIQCFKKSDVSRS